jgi:small-conductance mechanosensitive channel
MIPSILDLPYMDSINTILMKFHVLTLTRAFILLLMGWAISRLVSISISKLAAKRLRVHQVMLFRRVSFYLIFILFAISAVQQLGFDINAILGATGILTVALGIASQTSMSNIVSGAFILGEQPFEIGDTIAVNGIKGEVLAIDFFSVKIRTIENTMIRVPNEILMKSPITNLSYFPTRRIELLFSVNFTEDLERVKALLLTIAKKNPYCLAQPEPIVSVEGFGDATINLQLALWANKNDSSHLKNTVQADIKNGFIEHEIDMAFPSRSVFLESKTSPIQVKIIDDSQAAYDKI